VASAVDNVSSTASPAASGGASPKPNPVAHEVEVIATGARALEGSQKRELFTEKTNTVLVFENGGVIRLSAAVAAGQLFFVTNQESQREVVAQVIRSRSFGPASFYVELEFTEPAPGFWGPVPLPEPAQPATPAGAVSRIVPKYELTEKPKINVPSPQQVDIAKLVREVEAAGEELGAPKPAPSAKELERLKDEVEALRTQVKSLTQTKPEENKKVPAVPAAEGKLFNSFIIPEQIYRESKP